MNARFAFTLMWLLIAAQPLLAQDLAELDRRHGFKDIRLDAHIDSVRGAKLDKEFKEKDEFAAKLYTVENPDYQQIGEVKVTAVELKTYNDLVYEIKVTADKDPRLMKALESLYGKADYDMKNETYFWKTDNLILRFRSQGKRNLEMTYISFVAYKNMKDDKNKKVQDIANDFD